MPINDFVWHTTVVWVVGVKGSRVTRLPLCATALYSRLYTLALWLQVQTPGAAAAPRRHLAPCVREFTSQRWKWRVFSTVSERAFSAIVLTVLPPQANLWS